MIAQLGEWSCLLASLRCFDNATIPHSVFGAAYVWGWNMGRVCCGLNIPIHVLNKPKKHRLLNLSGVEKLKPCIVLHMIDH